MTTILFLLVAYNNQDEVEATINHLMDQSDEITIRVAVCDNSIRPIAWSRDIESLIVARRPDNPGYLEGAFLALDAYLQVAHSTPDWIFVSNTDISLVSPLFPALAEVAHISNSKCILAPRITEGNSRKEMNPHLLRRRPNWRIALAAGLTSTQSLALMYVSLNAVRERTRLRRSRTPTPIGSGEWEVMYSPYGAILGLSKGFVLDGYLPRQVPLFMEESAIAEAALREGAPVIYFPSLHFHHLGQSSTGLLTTRDRARLVSQAFNQIWRDRRQSHLKLP